ncbi:hypothetical protein CTA1_6171 [Colletotrichum tanaceti]|uniref:Uncharacterized protein n=1 Tax=Colletotrichum tanaceti TaxID=1306861 RepID=A0A4U6X3X7_9PEZI|nr:hypothetical protein CTA1_6171 [Colletotrichum tanaceti]
MSLHRHGDHGAQRRDLVAGPDLGGHGGRQLADVVEALADPLLDAARLVAVAQARGQLGAQHLLQHGRADADADAGPQRAEQVRARDDDGRVLHRGVGQQRDQRRRDAGAAAEREQRHAGDDAGRGPQAQEDHRRRDGEHHEAVRQHRQRVVAAGALHEDAGGDAGGDGGDHGRHEGGAGEGGRGALDGLEEQGQEEDGGDVGGDAEEVGEVAGEERAVEDDVAGGEGVGGDAHLDKDEGGEEGRGGGEGGEGDGGGPAVVGARVEADEQGEDGGDEGGGAEEVDAADLFAPVGVVGGRQVEDEVDGDEGEHAQRDLAGEGPAPADRVGEQAAERGAGGGAGGEDDVEVALPDAALAQGHDVAEEDGDHAVHAAAADAGDGPGDAELREGAGEAAAQGAEGEDDIGEEKALLAAEDVAQLAVERLEAGQGDVVAVEGG